MHAHFGTITDMLEIEISSLIVDNVLKTTLLKNLSICSAAGS